MYKFINEYKSYFKRSDLDFGIYINPDLSMNIIDDITIISYKLQVLISEILLTHKKKFVSNGLNIMININKKFYKIYYLI